MEESCCGVDIQRTKVVDATLKAHKFILSPQYRRKTGTPHAEAKPVQVLKKLPLVLSFIKVRDDRRDLFPLTVERCANPISSRSARFRAKTYKRIMDYKSVTKIVSALNHMDDENIRYEWALVNSQVA